MPGVATIRVAGSSQPTAVAGAIAGVVRERGVAEVQAIGAAAVNQAVKSIAIARGYLLGDGIDLVCVPSFVDLEIDGLQRTAMRFEVRSLRASV
jgi:stage V sporulation protein S